MKKNRWFIGLIALVFVLLSATAWTADYSWHKEFGATLGTDGRSWSGLFLKSSITLEGSTSDAYETTISITDPTADRTITIPNKSGLAMLASTANALTPSGTIAVD